MDSPTTLFLLRHGEIDRPPVAQFDDAVLTERGRNQIHELAEAWLHAVPDYIYCSHLPRSVETASIFASVVRRPVRMMHDLEEWAATEQDVSQKAYKALERRCWEDFDFENEEGESLNHATERIVGALTGVARRHRGRPILVSGHSILFALFVAHVRGERATEAAKDRIAFGSLAITEHGGAFRIVKDFSG